MNQTFSNYKDFYESLIIGNRIKFFHNGSFRFGVLADKYLMDDNVHLDILFESEILERVPFFNNGKSIIEIL